MCTQTSKGIHEQVHWSGTTSSSGRSTTGNSSQVRLRPTDRPTGTRWRQRRRRRRRRRQIIGVGRRRRRLWAREREREERKRARKKENGRRCDGRSGAAGWVSYRGYAAHQNTIFEQVQRSKMRLAHIRAGQGGSSDLITRVCKAVLQCNQIEQKYQRTALFFLVIEVRTLLVQ